MTKEERKAYNKAYKKANKAKVKTYQAEYYKDNKAHIDSLNKQHYQANQATVQEYQKTYRQTNAEKLRAYYREKKLTDKFYAFKHNIRTAIAHAFRRKNVRKANKTEQILGCSFEAFKTHLEGLFEPWMNWDNRGLYNGEFNYGWDIDHIEPLVNATSESDVKRLNHYTNLRPLCSKINRDIKRHN
jgi:hypothetical protein